MARKRKKKKARKKKTTRKRKTRRKRKKTQTSDKYFIQKAIKRPGSLRAIAAKEGGLTRDGKIKLSWARKEYNRLRKKAEGPKKLTPSERKKFQKLHLFLKVLNKVRPGK